MTSPRTREAVQAWISTERAVYADVKYNETDRRFLVDAMKNKDYEIWFNFIGNYLKRAELFGLDTLQGRQALGKAIVTALHTLETAVEIHGEMPLPGHPSGEVHNAGY